MTGDWMDAMAAELAAIVIEKHPVAECARVAIHRVVRMAAFEGYQRGRYEQAHDLRSTQAVADELGITPRRVRALAASRGVGIAVGRDVLLRPEDVDALRQRKPGRPKATMHESPGGGDADATHDR